MAVFPEGNRDRNEYEGDTAEKGTGIVHLERGKHILSEQGEYSAGEGAE